MIIDENNSRHPDMSPEAIGARLRMVDELLELCLSLKEAGEAYRTRQIEKSSVQHLTVEAETPAM